MVKHVDAAEVRIVVAEVLAAAAGAEQMPCSSHGSFVYGANPKHFALEPNFPIIANSALFQREIARAMRKVANDPQGTRVRRADISNTDPHGEGEHWFTQGFRFTVRFEITKPL